MRRPERRRQAGSGDCELRSRQRLGAPQSRGRHLRTSGRLYSRDVSRLDCARRPERRRQAGPGDRELGLGHRLRAP